MMPSPNQDKQNSSLGTQSGDDSQQNFITQSIPLLEQTLSACDDGELFIERGVSEVLSFDDQCLKSASFDTAYGFGMRVVKGEKTGFAHATEMTLPALKRACESLRLIYDDNTPPQASPPPVRTNARLYENTDPTATPGFSDKAQILAAMDAYARAKDPRIVQVNITVAGRLRYIDIARAHGEHYRDERPQFRLSVSVTAEQKGRRENGYAGCGGRESGERFLTQSNWKKLVDEAIRGALVNLEAVPAPAGCMDVVLGPGWPGVLLHEAIGHGLEGDFNRKGTSAFAGRIGERIAAPGVCVIDDGTLEKRRGSLNIDDEGTPTQRTILIEDGILKGFMQDRLNARLMGEKSTGNGRREGFAHAPMPRMTNTFMQSGDKDPAEIIASLKDGIYAVNFGGGQVDITSGKFVFQCTEAYRVRGGKIEEPVKGMTLIGDGPTVLTQIKHIGNDMALDSGIGVCGKAGQSVPVGVGQPSLYVENMTIGGAQV